MNGQVQVNVINGQGQRGRFELVEVVAEHAELERRLADPSVHADQRPRTRLARRYAELGAVVRAYDE